MKVQVQGLKELDAALNQLTSAASLGVLRRVGRAALVPFDKAWREKAPELTGSLKESGGIGSSLSKRQRAAHVRESTVEVFAGPGPDPAGVQDEFGNEHQAPQPFVRPAWDETQGQALDIVVRELGVEIDKAAARAAKKAAKLARG